MGWGDCGDDSRGRPIGYYHEATCDHPGCEAVIDRGLSYACGGMHGNECAGGCDEVDWSADAEVCDRYFCERHLRMPCLEHEDGADLWAPAMCFACADRLERAYREDPDWRDMWPTAAPPLPLNEPPHCGLPGFVKSLMALSALAVAAVLGALWWLA